SARNRAPSTPCWARRPSSTRTRSTRRSRACRASWSRSSSSSSARSSAASWSRCTCPSSSSARWCSHRAMDPYAVQLLLSPPALAVLGLCIGSFLNVVIHRLPPMLEHGWRKESAELLGVKVDEAEAPTLSKPRSRCPACQHPIAWHENLPVVSYLL